MASGLKDIASHLGVSVSLVSKVLNNRLGTSTVSDQLAAAIRARAAEVGYRPNTSARALVSGRQHVLGVLVHRQGEAGSGIVSELMQHLADAAEQQQQRLWLNFVGSSEEMRDRIGRAHPAVVDGLIVAGIPHEDVAPDLLRLEQAGVPVVTIHDEPLDPRLPNVSMDQRQVQAIATAHLIEQGCRRIVHVDVHPRRRAGHEQALAEHGVDADPALLPPGQGFHYKPAEAAFHEFLERGVPFDAVAAPSDQHAIAAMNLLIRRGITVPDQVRVTGIDNSPQCHTAIVPLTSVSQEFGPRAQQAIAMLMRRIVGEAVEHSQFDPVLHVRASSQ